MKEWIVTNGLGGYASLTKKNYNTRKFHGLLVSSLNPPTERWFFVKNIYDSIITKGKEIDLKDVRCDFSFDYFPTLSYKVDDIEIKKTIFMEKGKDTTLIRYDVKTEDKFTINHRPFINSRHFYDLRRKRDDFFYRKILRDEVKIYFENVDRQLRIILNEADYKKDDFWEETFYKKDHERGESWIENNYVAGTFKKDIEEDLCYYIILTLEKDKYDNPSGIFYRERQNKENLVSKANLPSKFNELVLSADNFLVEKNKGKSVIAGYHWFSDWGRDTLISLPGLALTTRRFNDAKQILAQFRDHIRNGLIPNTFMDKDSTPIYNSVDSSLWFIDRFYQYLKYTNDLSFLEESWDSLASIIDNYIKGTDYNIYMDDDYLISHDPGLTWMDVKIGEHYVTPRDRKAVEIQALWYNALRIMSVFAQKNNYEDRFSDLSLKVKHSFNKQYDDLYDVIDSHDASVRPNMLFLVSLDYSMVPPSLQKKIVSVAEEKLMTVFGPRTLSPDEPEYKGSYLGDYNRDVAYHNGTVWPWLMGPFIKAYVKIKKEEKEAWRDFVFDKFLKPMLHIFGPDWDGSIPEIFDGDPVYLPRGCISQAWSVAEILRAWAEDIEDIRPDYEEAFSRRIYLK
ncbi:MAG: amylo-alpha-1,6-glucosidase [Candidatus Thermoplasmatota archaeon]